MLLQKGPEKSFRALVRAVRAASGSSSGRIDGTSAAISPTVAPAVGSATVSPYVATPNTGMAPYDTKASSNVHEHSQAPTHPHSQLLSRRQSVSSATDVMRQLAAAAMRDTAGE